VRPSEIRSILHGVIVTAFVSGAIIGALLTQHASRWAMAIPAVAVLIASAFAFSQRNAPPSMPPGA